MTTWTDENKSENSDFLLLENNDKILLESGDNIILTDAALSSWDYENKS